MTSICEHAFENCTALTDITLPDSVNSIEGFAFQGCTALTSVNLPASLNTIGRYSFDQCEDLCNVQLSDNVTTIRDHAFNKCKSLTRITIPNSVIEIEENAFAFTGLIDVVIPTSVKTLAVDVFAHCEDLKSLTILCPITVKNIFWNNSSSLETVTLGAGIKKIDEGNFDDSVKVIKVPAKKTEYYKKRLSEKYHALIVEQS